MNNAAQWAIVEESLPSEESRRGVAEIEHLAAVDADTPLELVTDAHEFEARMSWLVADGTVLTAARWTPAT